MGYASLPRLFRFLILLRVHSIQIHSLVKIVNQVVVSCVNVCNCLIRGWECIVSAKTANAATLQSRELWRNDIGWHFNCIKLSLRRTEHAFMLFVRANALPQGKTDQCKREWRSGIIPGKLCIHVCLRWSFMMARIQGDAIIRCTQGWIIVRYDVSARPGNVWRANRVTPHHERRILLERVERDGRKDTKRFKAGSCALQKWSSESILFISHPLSLSPSTFVWFEFIQSQNDFSILTFLTNNPFSNFSRAPFFMIYNKNDGRQCSSGNSYFIPLLFALRTKSETKCLSPRRNAVNSKWIIQKCRLPTFFYLIFSTNIFESIFNQNRYKKSNKRFYFANVYLLQSCRNCVHFARIRCEQNVPALTRRSGGAPESALCC